MEAKQGREGNIEQTTAQDRVALLRSELENKRAELDDLLLRSETLHPSAYATLRGQLEEELEKLQAELNRLTDTAR